MVQVLGARGRVDILSAVYRGVQNSSMGNRVFYLNILQHFHSTEGHCVFVTLLLHRLEVLDMNFFSPVTQIRLFLFVSPLSTEMLESCFNIDLTLLP
jgi:hypothetical protein